MNIHSAMPRAAPRPRPAPLSPPRRAAARARPPRRAPAGPHARDSDKREAILRAAVRVFARHGYFNAQVADVARDAGVAAGTVYLYFRSKDDLLVSIFERTMHEARTDATAALEGLSDPIARLHALARLHLDRLGRDRDLAVVFQVELRQSTKFMERLSSTLLREYLGLIRDTIADAQAQGAFRRDINPTVAAKILFGALDEMATNWILSKRRYSLVADADVVMDLLVHGLGTKNTKSTRSTKV
jgi:TetR/AcrR family transcriptional regulator, fatty acid metabolism regulator protein